MKLHGDRLPAVAGPRQCGAHSVLGNSPAKIDRRIIYYLSGVVLGCLILAAVLPRIHRGKPARPQHYRLAPVGYYPLSWTDAYGRDMTLPATPWRIISLAPSITEILYAMGIEDRIVANTRWCRFPPQARELPKIGTLDRPNRELMIHLRPHLVLGTVLTPPNIYYQLGEAGLLSVAFAHKDIDGVLNDVKTIGKLLGVPGAALKVVNGIESRREGILSALRTQDSMPRRRVLLLYDLKNLSSAGAGSWPGDMIELCHAINIASGANSPWPRLSLEGAIAADPEVILLAVAQDEQPLQKARAEIADLSKDPVWRQVSAVRNGRVVIIDKDLLVIPGPRMVDALEVMALAIHPEAFATAP